MVDSKAKVAVLSDLNNHRNLLTSILQRRGFKAFPLGQERVVTPIFPKRAANVALASQGDALTNGDVTVIQGLDQCDLCLIDISGGISERLEVAIAQSHELDIPTLFLDEHLPSGAQFLLAEIELKIVEKLLEIRAHAQHFRMNPEKTWFLAASTGGPEAVKAFVQNLLPNSDFAFLYAQHIDVGFESNLVTMLDGLHGYSAKIAASGEVLRPKSITIIPTHCQVRILPGGVVFLDDDPWQGEFQPSINASLLSFGKGCGYQGGCIVFSGMGDDGASGARLYKSLGGKVWAQSPESCIVSSMPSSVIDAQITGTVDTPENLAKHLSASSFHNCAIAE